MNTLIASCFELSDMRFVDLTAHHVDAQVSVLGPGVLVGSALSPDGHWLYAVSNTLQVSIVDVGKRVLSRQITLPRQGGWSNPGFVALTADGTRLVVGENVQAIAGTDTAIQLQAYDTRTWQLVAQIDVNRPLFSSIASGPSGHVLFALGAIRPQPPWSPGTIVFAVDLDHSELRPLLQRPNEEILRLFVGP
jgi:hypothetical protein